MPKKVRQACPHCRGMHAPRRWVDVLGHFTAVLANNEVSNLCSSFSRVKVSDLRKTRVMQTQRCSLIPSETELGHNCATFRKDRPGQMHQGIN